MFDILVTSFIILLLGSGLAGVVAIILSILLIFIKDTNKRQPIEKALKLILFACIISFCIGFGLCTYTLLTSYR